MSRKLRFGVDPTGDVIEELRAEARWGDWRTYALCQRIDPELWFPEHGGSSRPAVRFCHTCPVMAECRADALERREPWGVWGGQSQGQREVALASEDGERAALIEALAHADSVIEQDDTGEQAA